MIRPIVRFRCSFCGCLNGRRSFAAESGGTTAEPPSEDGNEAAAASSDDGPRSARTQEPPYYIRKSPNKTEVAKFFGPLSEGRDESKPKENKFSFPTKSQYYSHTPGKTNYLTGHPTQVFPHNPVFHARGIVGEETRQAIYKLSKNGGQDIASIAAKFGLGLERVQAIIRLKAEDEKWDDPSHPQRSQLEDLKTMSETIRSMLPQHEQKESLRDELTPKQASRAVFVTIPEGMTYTREDAAKEFGIKEELRTEAKEYPKKVVPGNRYDWVIEDRPFRDEVHKWGRGGRDDRKKVARKLW